MRARPARMTTARKDAGHNPTHSAGCPEKGPPRRGWAGSGRGGDSPTSRARVHRERARAPLASCARARRRLLPRYQAIQGRLSAKGLQTSVNRSGTAAQATLIGRRGARLRLPRANATDGEGGFELASGGIQRNVLVDLVMTSLFIYSYMYIGMFIYSTSQYAILYACIPIHNIYMYAYYSDFLICRR